jgi:hypothetical protein
VDDFERAAIAGQVAAALAAAGMAISDPVVGAAAAGAVPVLTAMHDRWLAGQRRKYERTVGTAVEESGLAPEELASRLTSTVPRAALLGEVMDAAARTALEEKLDVLGRLLARGALADETSLDEELMWVRIMAQLEAPHLRALTALDAARPDDSDRASWMYDRTRAAFEAVGATDPVLRSHVLSELETSKLAQWRYGDSYPASYGLSSGGSAGDRFWNITKLGTACLDRFYRRGEQTT